MGRRAIVILFLVLGACAEKDSFFSLSDQWYEEYGPNLQGFALEYCKGLTGPECEEFTIDAFIEELSNYYNFDASQFDSCIDLDLCPIEEIEDEVRG